MAVPIHLRLAGKETADGPLAQRAKRSMKHASMPAALIRNENPAAVHPAEERTISTYYGRFPNSESPTRQSCISADQSALSLTSRVTQRDAEIVAWTF